MWCDTSAEQNGVVPHPSWRCPCRRSALGLWSRETPTGWRQTRRSHRRPWARSAGRFHISELLSKEFLEFKELFDTALSQKKNRQHIVPQILCETRLLVYFVCRTTIVQFFYFIRQVGIVLSINHDRPVRTSCSKIFFWRMNKKVNVMPK